MTPTVPATMVLAIVVSPIRSRRALYNFSVDAASRFRISKSTRLF